MDHDRSNHHRSPPPPAPPHHFICQSTFAPLTLDDLDVARCQLDDLDVFLNNARQLQVQRSPEDSQKRVGLRGWNPGGCLDDHATDGQWLRTMA